MPQTILNSENGGATIIVVLLVLSLLTIIIMSSTRTTNIESLIVINDDQYKKSFYKAESAIQEAAEKIEIEDELDKLIDNSLYPWMNENNHDKSKNPDHKKYDMSNFNDWDTDTINENDTAEVAGIDPGTTSFSAGYTPPPEMNAPVKFVDFKIYGKNESANARTMIEIGYRKIFYGE